MTSHLDATVSALIGLAGSPTPHPRLSVLAMQLLDVPATGVLVPTGDGAELVAAATRETGLDAVLAVGAGSGPGPDCLRTGRASGADDLAASRHRWLAFAARATAAGVRAAYALPLRPADTVPGTPVGGALLLLSREPGPLPPSARTLGQALADAAAVGLRHAGEMQHVEDRSEQLEGALRTRIVIEQAKGALAVHTGLDPEEAFRMLRGHARRHGRPLVDVAADVVAGRIGPDSVARPAP